MSHPSVPAMAFPEGPRVARRAVPLLDITQAPLDLGARAGLPIGPGGCHLRPWQRLRDAVRAAGVGGVDPPAALPGPDVVQAAELLLGVEPERGQHLVCDGLGRARAGY